MNALHSALPVFSANRCMQASEEELTPTVSDTVCSFYADGTVEQPKFSLTNGGWSKSRTQLAAEHRLLEVLSPQK